MDKERVIKLLQYLDEHHPNLFVGYGEDKQRELADLWADKLKGYSAEEVWDAIQNYPFPRLTGYKPQILADIVEGMEEERHRTEAMERYKKSLERIRLPEVEVQQTERIIDCATCTEPDRQFCGGGICMKLLGGR